MSTLLNLTDEDYLLIEDAIAANARGRAFLRMRDQRSRVVATDDVKRLVRSLTTSVKKAASPENEGGAHIRILRQELHDMSVCIQQTRSEVAALRPDETGNNRIMAATGELDAIVTATERATSEILNSAERIQALVSRMPRDPETKTICEELETQVTEILTACSFQDITGQRTTKVVNTLHYLEKRVNSMIEIWGPEALTALGAVERGNRAWRESGDAGHRQVEAGRGGRGQRRGQWREREQRRDQSERRRRPLRIVPTALLGRGVSLLMR